MALTDENSMVMPVAPINNGGFGGGFGGDCSWWIIIFLLMFGWGNNFGGYGGGFGADGLYPWLNNSQNINGGFRDQMLTSQIQGIQNGITSGFGDVQTALCGGFAGVNAGIAAAQNGITQQMYANQISDLERSFAAQTANTQGMSALQAQLAQCCCDNRLATCQTQNIVQNEGNATRFADANNTRDIIDSQTRGTQAILDKLCQLELDGVKQQVDAKNDRIRDLQNQLNQAVFRESQANQNALFAQGMNNEVDALYNRLKNCPVGTTPVYGNQPIFTCGNNGGCGTF